MDTNQTTPMPERQPAPAAPDQLSADKLEAKAAPAAAEASANGPKADDGAAVAQAQVASVATDDAAQAQADPAAAATTPPPSLAADVDVIEPEWVKKAEEAVAKHRNDPHAEEEAVEDVQREYLKARYNLDVKPGDPKP